MKVGVAGDHVIGRGLPGVLAHGLEGVVEEESLRGRAALVLSSQQNQHSCLDLRQGKGEGEGEGEGKEGRECLRVEGENTATIPLISRNWEKIFQFPNAWVIITGNFTCKEWNLARVIVPMNFTLQLFLQE